MKNYIQRGDVLDVTLAADVASGGVVVAGELVGVATTAGVTGDVVSVNLCGVFEVAKATGAISLGAKVYWDAANSNATTTASGNKQIGHAWVAALSGDATVQVKLLW